MVETPLTFERFQRPLPGLSGHDRLLLFQALPEKFQDEMWHRLSIKAADRHFAEGRGPFIQRRTKPRRRSRRAFTTLPSDEWRRGTEALASIPAETYLAVLAPESDPSRGRCRCPLPDHEDRNPSSSYRDTSWYCHVCGKGGGIFQLGSALSGLGDHGDQFGELRRWLTNQMLGAAA